MGPLRASPIAALLLLACLPAAASAAPRSAADPGCAAGPTTVGDTTWGTPCADTIVAPPQVETVHGGGGDDTILPAPIAASAPCPDGCHLGVGSQTFDGGPGDDVVYGERGNDILNGGEGNDRLYGGIGDDLLHGGPGDDRLSGGFGADSIDGEAGDDFVRGDATLDRISDSGGGVDTLSYATGVTPGFPNNSSQGYPNFSAYANFPALGGERGVYIDLEAGKGSIADNGVAPDGGGVDGGVADSPDDEDLQGTDFEKIIGTPFSDFIVGSSAAETIYGGGGADVILGGGGGDTVHGGADGDHCEEFATETSCENVGGGVDPRDPGKVSVGLMAPEESSEPALYLTGSEGDDDVTATYSGGASPTATFQLSGGTFDSSPSAAGGCDPPAAGKVVCPLPEAPDSLLLAGLAGNDTLSVAGFPDSTSIVALGGEGNDSLTGGDQTEDVLADGPGIDHLAALGGDDALLNNGGIDTLDGGRDNDLLLSDSICDGDQLNGGEGEYRDNASWTKLKEPVAARLDAGVVGRPVGGQPSCSGGGSLDHLQTIEDLEGSSKGDFLYGDSAGNQLLGHAGADSYFALGGNDTILANSGDSDLVIDCGDGSDTAFIDRPTATYADPAPTACENVFEADPNDFQPPGTPTGPVSPTVGPQPVPVPGGQNPRRRDRTPPRTRLLHRPAKTVLSAGRRRTVTFAFASNEVGGSFRCKLDRDRLRPCRSPRAYRLAVGAHAFRVFAVDPAGNRDRSPALARFRIRRR
jgi:Ca2+-binding RTX toxin-like protein